MEEEEFWDEDELDDQSKHCDYCDNFEEEFPNLEFFKCEDPDFEEVKKGCIIEYKNICSDCCTERIYEALCDCESCTIFEQRYIEIRKKEIINIVKSKNQKFEFENNIFFCRSDRFPINLWEYHLKVLPEELKGGIEREEKDFKIIYSRNQSTKLQFIDDLSGFFTKLKILDVFKKNKFKIRKYYEKKIKVKVDEGVRLSKLLIVEFQDDYQHLPFEYLIIQMLIRHFIFSPEIEYIYNPHQISVVKKVIEKIENRNQLNPLKLFFAQMNLRRNYYNENGTFLREKKRDIILDIKKNLNEAIKSQANFIIFPEYSFPREIIPFLQKFSNDYKIWIVGGAERFHSDKYKLDIRENATFIITPLNIIAIQKKNFKGKNEPPLKTSQKLKIFESGFGNFSVLVCADFLEDSLVSRIIEELDFMLVISFNKDVKRFTIKARDRCLSNLCYIIINNITKYNGAGVYAPFKRKDSKIELINFPFFEVNLTEFTLHRNKIIKSEIYKNALSETLYDYETSYFKFY